MELTIMDRLLSYEPRTTNLNAKRSRLMMLCLLDRIPDHLQSVQINAIRFRITCGIKHCERVHGNNKFTPAVRWGVLFDQIHQHKAQLRCERDWALMQAAYHE